MADDNQQNPVFSMPVKPGTLNAIMKAAKKKVILHIKYIDAKGVVSDRDTEPYEVKGNKYWGYDIDKESIRQFNMERILSTQVTQTPFTPRFPIKI